jgi:hypothetical protein
MLGVIDRVCTEGLTVAPGAPPPTVALVVGSAHLPGRAGHKNSIWVYSSSTAEQWQQQLACDARQFTASGSGLLVLRLL